MLIDGAIRFTEQAREGVVSGTSRSRSRVLQGEGDCHRADLGLNPTADPALHERLTGLYTFIFTRLVDASSERSVEIDEVLDLFRFERETWSMLIANLANENVSAASVTEMPDVSSPAPAGQLPRPRPRWSTASRRGAEPHPPLRLNFAINCPSSPVNSACRGGSST